ncbi:MAG: hypothetical protein EXR45_05540 [Chloroflexi bacterium]|nr:hypothetical protein [Chloroflexota bacterium]
MPRGTNQFSVHHATPEPQVILADWLSGLRVGDPLSHHGLTLVPVYPTASAALVPYETLATAIAARHVTVTELNGGSVPELSVQHRGPVPVLLIDGDQVEGGRQNRVVNTTILVPVGVDFTLPVSCVEQGRWRETRVDFSSGEIVPPSVRRGKENSVRASYRSVGAPRSDQGEVWARVSESLSSAQAVSRTSDLSEAYSARRLDLEDTRINLPCPNDGPVGVVAIFGGDVKAADIFDRAETLLEFWPRLIRSYALEAITSAVGVPDPGSLAHAFISTAAQATATVNTPPGLGQDVRLSGSGVSGAALIHGGASIHTALYGTQDLGEGPSTPSGRGSVVASPRTRRTTPTRSTARAVTVGNLTITVVAENLLTLEAEALILSANKRLNGGSGLSAAVERAAGPSFVAERDRIVPTGPSNGFFRGTAVVTSSGNLAAGRLRRRLIHAITIKYEHGHRIPTTPEIVYAAVRDALDRAEVYGIESLGTYLMATRTARVGEAPWATAPRDIMATALVRAVLDHARIANHVRTVTICETEPERFDMAWEALRRAYTVG